VIVWDLFLSLINSRSIIKAIIHDIDDDLTEEIGEMHGNHDEDDQIIKESNDAEECFWKEIQRWEKVCNPNDEKNENSDLECKMESLPRPNKIP